MFKRLIEMVKYLLIFAVIIGLQLSPVDAQEKLYSNTFPLSDIELLDGPFKHAQDLNVQTLLKYDVDRLLAPYLKVAGLPPKAENYGNWESDGLDGHIGGHYLSAMAMHYASTGNVECLRRMEYMIGELNACQQANATKYPDWGVGYVGGVPNSNDFFTRIKSGDMEVVWQYWVPWYNVHKMFAGLRDAWLYAGNEAAKGMFIEFCGWAVNLTKDLSDIQMEAMLANEHGGMNEVLADAYQISGDEKYLTTAKRFSHKFLLDAMAAKNDNLDNQHANTQVPKAVGFQRIAELSNDEAYIEAGSFFWETVVMNRSLAMGGNSRQEFFPTVSTCGDYVNVVEGPESCNTNNMLKLTQDLFRVNPEAKYADYFERALYNHILSTQHPEHGGYVYFTPARPRHYRVYSAPNQAMWCCVGTGMENHGKYGEFIYTHQNDALYLNLYIASELNWKEKGLKLKQETNFPEDEKTKLTITEGSSFFSLKVRYPSWVASGELQIKVNGEELSITNQPSSYVAIERTWSAGDIVEINLPMHNTLEQMPNVPSYVAFMHGPILLSAKTGTDDMNGLIADDSRWAHIAGGKMLPVNEAPIIISDNRAAIADNLVADKNAPFTFTAPELQIVNSEEEIEFVPFYKIHDSRYMMYWMTLSNTQYEHVIDSIAAVEAAKLALEERTIDFVQPGQQQPEADHTMQSLNSFTGTNQDGFWRDARDGGYFSYLLSTNNETNLSLMVKYWGNDSGSRTFGILIDDEKLVTENISGKWNVSEFHEVEYSIPNSMLEGNKIRVKFQSRTGSVAGGVFFIRLLRQDTSTDVKKNFKNNETI